MKIAPTIIKNSGILILKQIFLCLISLVAVGYIARGLGEVDYGKYAFAFAFVALFKVVGEMGIYTLTVREVAANQARAARFLGDAIFLRMALSVVMLSSIVMVIHIMKYPEDTRIVVYIAAGALFFDSLAGAFTSLFEGFQKMQFVAFLHSVISLIQAAAAILILSLGFKLIPLAFMYLGGSILSCLLAFLITVRYFVLPEFSIDLERFKSTLKEAFPFALIVLFNIAMFKVDIVMLSFFKGDAVAGWYNAATVLTYNTIIISSALSTSVFPAFSSLGRGKQDVARSIFEKSFSFLIFIGLPIAIGTTFTAKQIIPLVFGDRFTPSVLILQVIIWYIPVVYVGSLLANVLNAYNCQRYVAKTAGIQAGANVIMNLLMIPVYGAIGAAVATVVTEVIGVSILYFKMRCFFSFAFMWRKASYLTVSNIVLIVFLLLFYGWNLAIVIPSSVAIYFLMLLQLGVLDRKDLDVMKGDN